MKLAIGRLRDADTAEELGTVFACGSLLALTAFHCVGDRVTGSIKHRRLTCAWEGHVGNAVVQDFDTLNDVALLRLKRNLPPELRWITPSTDVANHSAFTAPGAPAAVSGVFNYAISGKIVWSGARLDNDSVAMQLQCDESVAGLPLQGLSGAPVLVGTNATFAGMVRWNAPRSEEPSLAAGAAVFATPSDAILARWPELNINADDTDRMILLTNIASREGNRSCTAVAAQLTRLISSIDIGISERDCDTSAVEGLANGSRIDVRPGLTIIELRADLSRDETLKEAEKKPSQNMAVRSHQTGKRYAGLLTDGAEWRLYHRLGNKLKFIQEATLILDPEAPKLDKFVAWIETIMATGTGLNPSPREIARRLGADSPSYLMNKAELKRLYEANARTAYVEIRRDMWAKLLTTAAGDNFHDDDALFIDHTLLALMAQVIGHAVLDFHPEDPEISAADIVSGAEFSRRLIGGVIEADFFDWAAFVPGGGDFIKSLSRQLTRFLWRDVEHDVMKVLYQSIIPERVRHALGEYYTPDWLAEEIVAECVTDSLNQTVLDASCGSGTFLFHAIKRFISDAEVARLTPQETIRGVTDRVRGFDVHPVAVTLARVTYLLAIGTELLQHPSRPAFAVPVYLCDSLRWGQHQTLWSYKGLSVRTQPSHSDLLYDPEFTYDEGFVERLKFPDRVLEDTDHFDLLVTALADKAIKASDRLDESLNGIFKRFWIHPDDRAILLQTYRNMRLLHQQGRDHIWGYYVRNLARPIWMARPDNRIDVLIGNPPWLAYRYMTEVQKSSFREMSEERRLWAGAKFATSQDLAALFVARCVELYLKPGGRFGYVMPLGTLKLGHYEGFRRGHFPVLTDDVKVAFDRPWDLHLVKPNFFSQSVGVVFGKAGQILGGR